MKIRRILVLFQLKLKRNLLLFPRMLIVAAILCCAAVGFVYAASAYLRQDTDIPQVDVALVSYDETEFMESELKLIQGMYGEGTAYNIRVLDARQAQEALEERKVAAVIYIPEDFVTSIEQGKDLTVEMSFGKSQMGIGALMVKKLSEAGLREVVYSESGSYALLDVCVENGLQDIAGIESEKLGLYYLSEILNRAAVFEETMVMTENGLSVAEYYICAAVLVFSMLWGIAFAPVICGQSESLRRKLKVSGIFVPVQQLLENIAEFICYACGFCCIGFAGVAVISATGFGQAAALSGADGIRLILKVIPIYLMICLLVYFVFQLFRHIIYGTLMMFFVSMALCLVSGCFYPYHYLPAWMQRIGDLMPTTPVFRYLQSAFNGNTDGRALAGILLWGAAFFAASWLTTGLRERRGV